MTTDTISKLETGWRPETPVDDTFLRRFLHTFAASWEAVGRAEGGTVDRDERCSIVDLGRPAGMGNSATLLQPLLGAASESTLARVEARYDRGDQREALLWSAWPTPDLRPRGWRLSGYPPLLFRPSGETGRSPTRRNEVVEVTEPAGLATWSTVVVEGFPLEEVTPASGLLPTGILEDERWRFVLSREDGTAVAAGSQFIEHDLNLLVLSSTRQEARGQGHYSGVAADRIDHRSDLPAAAVVSDDSRPALVGRFGFVPLHRFTLWSRSSS